MDNKATNDDLYESPVNFNKSQYKVSEEIKEKTSGYKISKNIISSIFTLVNISTGYIDINTTLIHGILIRPSFSLNI